MLFTILLFFPGIPRVRQLNSHCKLRQLTLWTVNPISDDKQWESWSRKLQSTVSSDQWPSHTPFNCKLWGILCPWTFISESTIHAFSMAVKANTYKIIVFMWFHFSLDSGSLFLTYFEERAWDRDYVSERCGVIYVMWKHLQEYTYSF